MADYDWITADLINTMIQEAEEHPSRVKFIQTSRRCWKQYNADSIWFSPEGEPLVDSMLAGDYPISFENRIKKNVDDAHSVVLKNSPIIRHYAQPDRPQDAELADTMNDIMDSIWGVQGANIGSVLNSTELDAMISGMGTEKLVWDANNKKRGDGEILAIKIPASDMFYDPYATNDHRGNDCRYIIHRTHQVPEILITRYEKNAEIALGLKKGNVDNKMGKTRNVWGQFANLTKTALQKGLSIASGNDPYSKVDDRIDVYEVWLSPIVERENELVAGIKIEQKDFPYGLVVTMFNETIVRVIENPNVSRKYALERDELGNIKQTAYDVGSKRHPFVIFYWKTGSDENGFNGIYECSGMVDAMIPVSMSYNTLSTNIEINARSIANSQVVIREGALLDMPPDRITLPPGGIVTVSADAIGSLDDSIKQMTPGQMPAFVDAMRQDKKAAMSELGGIHPAMVGLAPQGTSHLPGNALSAFQEASLGPLAIPVRNLETAIYDISILAGGLMQQYYTPGRFIDISNDGEQRYAEWTKRHIVANFIRKVVAGSTTPMADIERERKMAEITTVVEQALQSGNPMSVQNVILFLKNIRNANAYDHIQLLQKYLQTLEQQQHGLQQLGMAGLMSQQQMQGQEQEEDYSSLVGLAQEMGVDPQAMIDSLGAA